MDLHEIEFRGLKTVAELPALGAARPPPHTRLHVHGHSQVGKETIPKEKQEVGLVSHRLDPHPHPDLPVPSSPLLLSVHFHH